MTAQTVTETFTIEGREVTVAAMPSQVPGRYQIDRAREHEWQWRDTFGYVVRDETRPAERQWVMYGPEGPSGPEYGAGRATLSDAMETLARRDVWERRKG